MSSLLCLAAVVAVFIVIYWYMQQGRVKGTGHSGFLAMSKEVIAKPGKKKHAKKSIVWNEPDPGQDS
jgi:hypothetical protein